MKRILISNDDGINAPGLIALEEALSSLGEIYVFAPSHDYSACSHSLTLRSPLRVFEHGERRYSTDGTPSDAVNLAINGIFRDIKFDMAVAGINAGGNMGDDITYSGTVSAAMEATILGVPSFAVSLEVGNSYHWETAKKYALRTGELVLKEGLEPNIMLNVNVPNVPANEVAGVVVARQGKRVYGDGVVEKIDPRGEKYYWIGGLQLGHEPIEGSDLQSVAQKKVSITPIKLDMTDYDFLNKLRGLEF